MKKLKKEVLDRPFYQYKVAERIAYVTHCYVPNFESASHMKSKRYLVGIDITAF